MMPPNDNIGTKKDLSKYRLNLAKDDLFAAKSLLEIEQ